MHIERDETAGHDRRAFIRRSLIGGGVALATPVATTFNVPAGAAIASGATNQFQVSAVSGDNARLGGTAAGNRTLSGVDSSDGGTCEPTNWDIGTNPTVAADFSGGSASVNMPVFPANNTGTTSQTLSFSITLPDGCTPPSTAAGIAVLVQKRSGGNDSESTGTGTAAATSECPTENSVSVSGQTVTFSVTATETHPAGGSGTTTFISGVTVRLLADC